ncbi:MAG: general stress protein [Alphaproteobacteria bacterium]|nr:general stress protein [Alphaproteobacteria bacterium]
MPSERDIVETFWDALKSDRTIMLSLAGERGGDAQPMTAVLDEDHPEGPIWIFSAKDVDLVQAVRDGGAAVATFASKGHSVFATVHGALSCSDDRTQIDRLWNPFIAAWYEGGKDDPKLQLLRFDASRAHIWLNENSLFAGIEAALGADPKRDYQDKTADVAL